MFICPFLLSAERDGYRYLARWVTGTLCSYPHLYTCRCIGIPKHDPESVPPPSKVKIAKAGLNITLQVIHVYHARRLALIFPLLG